MIYNPETVQEAMRKAYPDRDLRVQAINEVTQALYEGDKYLGLKWVAQAPVDYENPKQAKEFEATVIAALVKQAARVLGLAPIVTTSKELKQIEKDRKKAEKDNKPSEPKKAKEEELVNTEESPAQEKEKVSESIGEDAAPLPSSETSSPPKKTKKSSKSKKVTE